MGIPTLCQAQKTIIEKIVVFVLKGDMEEVTTDELIALIENYISSRGSRGKGNSWRSVAQEAGVPYHVLQDLKRSGKRGRGKPSMPSYENVAKLLALLRPGAKSREILRATVITVTHSHVAAQPDGTVCLVLEVAEHGPLAIALTLQATSLMQRNLELAKKLLLPASA